jgi:hypothetical protein
MAWYIPPCRFFSHHRGPRLIVEVTPFIQLMSTSLYPPVALPASSLIIQGIMRYFNPNSVGPSIKSSPWLVSRRISWLDSGACGTAPEYVVDKTMGKTSSSVIFRKNVAVATSVFTQCVRRSSVCFYEGEEGEGEGATSICGEQRCMARVDCKRTSNT